MNTTLSTKLGSHIRNGQEIALPIFHVNVVFISHAPFEPQVKIRMNSFSTKDQDRTTNSGGDLHFPAGGLPATLKMPRLPDVPPFAQWAPAADLFKTALANARNEGNLDNGNQTKLFDASMRALDHRQATDNARPDLKLVEFSLEMPGAKAVQLAADFTDWERAPIDMIRFDDSYWSTTVPLPAGIYSYRFLVDGEWYDDPRAIRRDPNSPSKAKAFVQVK